MSNRSDTNAGLGLSTTSLLLQLFELSISGYKLFSAAANFSSDSIVLRAKLAIDSRGRQLTEKVFIEVTLAIAARQRKFTDHIDGGYEQVWFLNEKLSVRHELAEC